jgi:hypothetical protein
VALDLLVCFLSACAVNLRKYSLSLRLNLPIIGIGLLGISLFLNLNIRRRTLNEKLHELDYLGTILFISAITSFLISVTWGGTLYPWDSWQTLIPLCLGLAGTICFCLWESLTKGPTLIPMPIFRNYSATILYFSSFVHGIILFSLVYYMPLYFQSVQNYTPTLSGVAALPQTATIVPCAVTVGIVVGKTGRYRWAIWAGWILTTFGMGLLCYLDVSTSVPAWVFLEMVSGIGIGLLFPSTAVAIQASTPGEEAAMTSTLVLWTRGSGKRSVSLLAAPSSRTA